ncbi:MAG: DUF1599 domain-containing protein [Bacteroidetes bacterium]|nr:DUF1599 domain-containing protein [Bacteroidota bacterium]
MQKTLQQYDQVVASCRKVFSDKMKDYGSSWRVLRTRSITDQIFIKATRIRNIDETGVSRVNEGIRPEFMGILNYSVMALIQLEWGAGEHDEVSQQNILESYDKHVSEAKTLMLDKNHDYGEIWRNMRLSSFTDIILMRILRIKQIEDNNGKTFVSEGVAANYLDIINYAVFALIQILESKENSKQP